MFYLSNFFKMIFSSGAKGITFLLLTVFFFVLTFSPAKYRNQLLGQTQVAKKNPSFFVLTNASLSQDFITNKLNRLASVKKVSFFTQKELYERIQNVIKEMGAGSSFITQGQQGLRVILRNKVSKEKVSLIQQYIKRLSPSSDFVFSNIKKPSESPGYLAKYSSTIALIGLSLSWILLALLMIKPIKKKAYIIEKFQRKNGVASKIIGSGMFLFIAVNMLGFSLLKQSFMPALIASSALFTVLTLITIKNSKWEV